MLDKKITWMIIIVFLLSFALVACGGTETTSPTAEEPAAEVEEPAAEAEEPVAEVEEPAAAGEKTKVDIFVGLGTGTDPDQVAAQEALAERFNSTHDDIEIEFIIVPNEESVQRLLAQVSGGNPPGLVGPGGVDVAAGFFDLWEDVQPFIDAENFDTSDFYGAAVELYQYPDKTVGLPLGMFPSFIYYNKDAFDAAGLDYPTTDYDDTSWDLDALRELALELTLDANGNNANSPDFDPQNIVEWGFDDSWTDMRGFMTRFDPPGAGRPTNEDATVALANSDEYKYGLDWLNKAIWEDHFMADITGQEALNAASGDPFGGGQAAMFYSHTWFMPEGLIDLPFDYGFAAPPFSQKGTRIARTHADTFYIPKAFAHKDASWEVLKWLTDEENIVEVCLVYGCLPSRQSVADEYTVEMENRYGENDYDVIYNSIDYLDSPHHESWMPNVERANEILGSEVYDRVYAENIDDTGALLEEVNVKLQALFDEYWASQ
jgi:multiple sugar transport system substrate-binding protein